MAKRQRERKDRVISFRIAASLADRIESWLAQSSPDPLSANQYAREVFLAEMSRRTRSGLLRGAIVDTVPDWDILVGDALPQLQFIREEVVDCIVTSPPYYKQRRYGHPDEIGQETTPEQYLTRLVGVFREIKRVLKPTGTCWINLDDTYHSKRLLGIPWRLAHTLQEDGWIVRGEQVWHKNGMCEGASDRPTRDHELVLLLTKRPGGYFYDADAIREPHTNPWAIDCIQKAQEAGLTARRKKNIFNKQARYEAGERGITRADYGVLMNPLGRNKRSVWRINTSKFKGAHYAPMPVELAELCIRAGCPQGGVVLDPFCGAGTTGVAAVSLGRKFIGIDLLEQHVSLAGQRIEQALLQCPTAQVKPSGDAPMHSES